MTLLELSLALWLATFGMLGAQSTALYALQLSKKAYIQSQRMMQHEFNRTDHRRRPW